MTGTDRLNRLAMSRLVNFKSVYTSIFPFYLLDNCLARPIFVTELLKNNIDFFFKNYTIHANIYLCLILSFKKCHLGILLWRIYAPVSGVPNLLK